MSEWRTNRKTGERFVTARAGDIIYLDRIPSEKEIRGLVGLSAPAAAAQLQKWHYGFFNERSNADGTVTETFVGNAGNSIVITWERPSGVGMEGSRVLSARVVQGRADTYEEGGHQWRIDREGKPYTLPVTDEIPTSILDRFFIVDGIKDGVPVRRLVRSYDVFFAKLQADLDGIKVESIKRVEE